jgi:hypothetical protein
VKPIHIVAADDERVLIPFIIPIKGRKPLQITLPRYDYLDEDQFDALSSELTKLDENTELSARKKGRMVALSMLRHVVSDREFAVLETLATGQLDQILEGWREHSVTSLGESPASADSSTGTTGAPSDTTSSPEDGDAPTSDAV